MPLGSLLAAGLWSHLGMGGGQGPKLVFRGILAALTKGVYNTLVVCKSIWGQHGLSRPIPPWFMSRGKVRVVCVTLSGLFFTTSFPLSSKPFPDVAGLRADSHKLQKPLEIGGRFLTEPATHRDAPTPLPGKTWDQPQVGCSSGPRPGRSRGCPPRGR